MQGDAGLSNSPTSQAPPQITFVIAEIGVNHNGDMALARQLISAAADAGADAVKFQTFRADRTITKGARTVAYQKQRAGADDQHRMLSDLELSEDDFQELYAVCADAGVEFISTAFDSDSLDFLVGLGMPRIKVPSGEVTNTPFLEQMASYGRPVLLSTGMATLEEVRLAVETLLGGPKGRELDLTVLHCTSAYPAPPDMLNLRAMETMARELELPVGYSDHSDGILMAPVAVALGARVIEKHITLDRTMTGPDHAASIEADAFRKMVDDIRSVERAMGDGVKEPKGSEAETASLVRRGVKAARELPAGHVLTAEDLVILRPETGAAPSRMAELIDRTLASALAEGSPVDHSHILP